VSVCAHSRVMILQCIMHLMLFMLTRLIVLRFWVIYQVNPAVYTSFCQCIVLILSVN